MPEDYGCFGKGQTGYAHYLEAFNRNNKSGEKKPGGRKSGYLTTVLLMFLVVFIIRMDSYFVQNLYPQMTLRQFT